jgi:hypothetical protein
MVMIGFHPPDIAAYSAASSLPVLNQPEVGITGVAPRALEGALQVPGGDRP